MKKAISMLLVLVMMLSMVLVGCSGGAGKQTESNSAAGSSEESSAEDSATESNAAESEESNEAENAESTPSSARAFKIGAFDSGSSDATSAPLLKQLESTVEALGGELVYATVESSADSYIAAIENLISKGCDALILPNTIAANGLIGQVDNMCSQAGVYYSLYWTNLEEGTDDYETAMNSEAFVSTTCEDDVYSAYFAAKQLGEAGCTKIVTITLPLGFTTTNMRNEGIEQACEEFGMEVVGTESDAALTVTSAGGADIMNRFMTAYPDADGLCIAGMTQFVLPGVVQALEEAGKVGEIKIAAIDFNEYQTKYMEEGALNAIIGGHFAGPSYSAILIANKLNGTPLVDGPVILEDKFIELSSVDDAKAYDEKVYNGSLYTAEEIADCLVVNNPDFTYEKLEEMAASYGLEDIIERHSK